jgi:glutamate 5-kinase
MFLIVSSYFAALAKGDVESFLEDQAKRKKLADAQAAAAAGQPPQ